MRYGVTLLSRETMKKKKVLTTGEFAKLCRTTKETLFHYDKEGLLRPKLVSECGYRYYGVEQFLDWDIILTLKETGCSLREIKTYLQDMNEQGVLSFLETRRTIIKKEKQKLAQREMILNDMITCIREVSAFEHDTLVIQMQKEECFEIFPIETAWSESMPEFVECFAEYIDYFEKQGRMLRYPFGIIFGKEDGADVPYVERYFFSRAVGRSPRGRLHIKPEGLYAVLVHQGTQQTHELAFDLFLRKTRESGWRMTGNAYMYDMIGGYSLPETGPCYSCKYCIQVIPDKNGSQ